ncbi:MAG: hypothetical protein M1499_05285 [Firmicutes bacterium]|nr:hypothetical protein [Bacillota bacterium]
MIGSVKIGRLTFPLHDFTALTIGTVTKIMTRGGAVAITASDQSGHSVRATVSAPVEANDGTQTPPPWTVTCASCGRLGVWDNPVDALRTMRHH